MNILVTGVGGPTPLGIAKSIRNSRLVSRIIGVDCSPLAPGLYNNKLFDRTYLVPHSEDERYWAVVERIVREERIDYAFVVPEREVLAWSERQKVELPCPSLIPDLSVARVCYDKYLTAQALRGLGITPRTALVS